MAMLVRSPTSTLPAANHRQKSGVLLRRPTRRSARRFQLHAEKPASPGAGNETSSSSENAVLRAAWYGSELLGIAASFFRPSQPPTEGDSAGAVEEAASEPQGRAQVAEAVKDDFARSYFVTGNLTLKAYEEDCEFADPAGSFNGLQRFKRNCTNFGSLLEKSNMKLTKWEDLEDKSIGHWRFSCVMSFPWRPILSATGYTEYYFDAGSGKACRALERPQDGTPAADFQAESMGMGETHRRMKHRCSS
ncbi:Os04g0578200 [Oryza sativa Japonica Group]|uniref:Os04g0578200 protein n=1 Tax=Oryza sativa subsp. japonica TaxID=39947 RepID=A0A0N7KJJ9_ORYSJ|nr:hypothetical protein EE612_025108 [Oryza sativa]KAF2935492.1 hypothetical protein DAI22_04g234700 [Oryza sativa Japonica Group]BAS90625.1 Os04g0578200 [Oryza sativa Japonica Group]